MIDKVYLVINAEPDGPSIEAAYDNQKEADKHMRLLNKTLVPYESSCYKVLPMEVHKKCTYEIPKYVLAYFGGFGSTWVLADKPRDFTRDDFGTYSFTVENTGVYGEELYEKLKRIFKEKLEENK